MPLVSTAAGSEWLQTIYRDHAPALHRLILRTTAHDRQRTEDVVQETFLRAWRNMSYLDANPRAIWPWLFTVARRIVVDQHRRRAARPAEVGDVALDVAAVPDGADAVLTGILVRDALHSLSESHLAVIRELYYRGHTTREAAAVLGIPQGTVKSRIYYALKALRLALAERGLTG